MKQSSFDAMISALDAETSALDMETSAFGAATSAIARRSFDATISALDAETSSLDAETSALGAAIARSYRRYRRKVYGDIGDCGVGITPQMCNRVTNHGDMSTFSKPVPVRVTRGAVIVRRYTYAPPRCRTSQYCQTFIPWSVSLWNDLSAPVFNGVGLVSFKSKIKCQCLFNGLAARSLSPTVFPFSSFIL